MGLTNVSFRLQTSTTQKIDLIEIGKDEPIRSFISAITVYIKVKVLNVHSGNIKLNSDSRMAG